MVSCGEISYRVGDEFHLFNLNSAEKFIYSFIRSNLIEIINFSLKFISNLKRTLNCLKKISSEVKCT